MNRFRPVSFFILFMASSLYVFPQIFLKADGKIIVNENGEKVILRGMGLGGWMLHEGYMFHVGNIDPQYKIKEKITELVAKKKQMRFTISGC